LYFIIASTAFASGMVPGLAFSYPFGIINIMNRMGEPPVFAATTSNETCRNRHADERQSASAAAGAAGQPSAFHDSSAISTLDLPAFARTSQIGADKEDRAIRHRK
jgi:hypothetical protein